MPTWERDRRNRNHLLQAGWRVAIVWECVLRKGVEPEIMLKLEQWLRGTEPEFETQSAPPRWSADTG